MAAVAAPALPSLAYPGGRSGIVAKVDVRSGLMAVAHGRGDLRLVYATASAARGLRLWFDANAAPQGTDSAKTFTVRGWVRRVHIRGTISAVDVKQASFARSAHGALLPLKLSKHARSPDPRVRPASFPLTTASLSADTCF